MRKFLVSLALLCTCFGLMAAQRTLKGNVADSGGGLPGASVLIKGTQNGTATDDDGNFTITVNDGDVLVVSYVGYDDKEVKITPATKSPLKVSLEEGSEMMTEVEVEAGYGKMRKQDVTGATSQLSKDAVASVPTASVDQALQGRVSGVQVTASSGQPGAEASVHIRGNSTLTGNTSPLYVIDGMPVGGGKESTGSNPLASINPNDILSMEVLKDASATAIYGSRAANGVILITTKRGGLDQPARIAYAGQFSISNPSNKLDLMDLQQYATFYTDENVYKSFFQTGADPELVAAASGYARGTDWQDEIFRTAMSHSHQVSVNGGSSTTQYAFSLGYMNQQGVLMNTDFERYNARTNIETQAKKWLRLGLNLAYARIGQTKQPGFELNDDNKLSGIGSGGDIDATIYNQALISKPSTAARDFNGDYNELGAEDQEIKINPARDAAYSPIHVGKHNVTGQVFATVNFLPENKKHDLSWRNEFGIDYSSATEQQFVPSNSGATNQQQFIFRDNFYWRFCTTANYIAKLGASQKHRLNAMAGFEAWKADWSGTNTKKSGYLDDMRFVEKIYQNNNLGETVEIGGYHGQLAMLSVLARANYGYDDRYLATVTGRFDGSSTLAEENRWDFFPSFSLAWRADQESFIKDNGSVKKIISSLKVRAGYGQTGNAGSNMAHISYYKESKGMDGVNNPGMVEGKYLNEGLRWETNWQINGGIDLGLLKGDRISVTFDAFYKRNLDLIVDAEPGISLAASGNWLYPTSVSQINAGSIENKGFDLTVTSTNIRKNLGGSDFTWTTDLNFSLVRNKVLSLINDSTALEGKQYYKTITRPYCLSRVGHAPGLFYGYKTDGIIQNTAKLNEYARPTGTQVGDINYVDVNGDGKIDSDDRTFIGDPNPDFTFGLNNTFSWGPWSLSVFLSGSYGNDVYNLLRSKLEGMDRNGINQLATVLDYARVKTAEDGTQYVENSNTNMPRPNTDAFAKDDANTISDRYIEDASFMRLQSIGLSYNLPKRYTDKMHMQNFRISFNVQNVATITNYSGLNPEVQNASAIRQGIDVGSYPLPRMYVMGLNFEF